MKESNISEVRYPRYIVYSNHKYRVAAAQYTFTHKQYTEQHKTNNS